MHPSQPQPPPQGGPREESPSRAIDALRARLGRVRIESDRLSLARFPDFLVVGPQRTGTTWLHLVLGSHPEVFLSDPKELYFFSRLQTPGHPRFESDLLDWYLDRFRDRLPRWIGKQARALVRTGHPYRPRVRGEATASYAAMDGELIDEVVVLNPGIKALFMVRDPVERAWSHAKKDLARNAGRKASEVPEAEWKAFFRDPYQRRCARYRECIDQWKARLAPGNVFVGTMEEVEGDPARLLGRVTRFLGVSPEERLVDPRLLDSTVNPTGPSPIPAPLRADLDELLAAEVADWKRLRDEVAATA